MTTLPKRIVAIGASTVFGRVDDQGGYIGRLKSWHEANDVHNAVFNLGIGGDTTNGMLKRLVAESNIRKPDLIIFSTGHNDAVRIASPESKPFISLIRFKDNVINIIKNSRFMCNIVFVSTHPIDDTKTQPFEDSNKYYLLEDAREYAEATKEICRKEQIPYLDIFNEWMSIDYKNYLYEDGLHPNAEGHLMIFQKLKSFLEELYS